MKKEQIFIGMLCNSSKGTGVVTWVDDVGKNIYMTDLPGTEYYKVKLDEIDSWAEPEAICGLSKAKIK